MQIINQWLYFTKFNWLKNVVIIASFLALQPLLKLLDLHSYLSLGTR